MNRKYTVPVVALMFGAMALGRLRAEPLLELVPMPTGDGEISSQGTLDSAAEAVEDLALGAKVGMYYGKLFVAIFEFALPPEKEGAGLKSASLELSSNTVSKESTPTPSPMTIEVYGYIGKNADGMVDASDWKGGEDLGAAVVRGGEIDRFGKLPSVNVTDFVRKALQAGNKFVGFRLQPKDLQGNQKEEGVVLRTAEFGQQYPGNQPKLELTFDE